MENKTVAMSPVQAPVFRAGNRNLRRVLHAAGLATGCTRRQQTTNSRGECGVGDDHYLDHHPPINPQVAW